MEEDFAGQAAREWGYLVEDVDRVAVAVAWRVRRIARQLDASLNAQLTAAGLSVVGDYEVIALLLRSGELRPSEIATLLQITPAGLNGRIRRLEEAELLSRRPDGADGRSYFLSLSQTGAVVAKRGFVVAYSTYQSLVSDLEQDEAELLASLLLRVLQSERTSSADATSA